jgi:hypothetical protein
LVRTRLTTQVISIIITTAATCHHHIILFFSLTNLNPSTQLNCRNKVAGVAPKYKGMVHALGRIASEEGLLGLYKGLGVTLVVQVGITDHI